MSDDDSVNEAAHKKLLAGINNLVRTQDVQKATRTEPSLRKSEFDLVKSRYDDGKKNQLNVGDLLGMLKKTNKHQQLGKELSQIGKRKKTLVKPLEKPVAERISRDALYGKVQQGLDLWEPVVTASEVAPQTSFPLQYGKVGVANEAPQKLSQYRVKSDLMKAMEELDKKYQQGDSQDEDDAEPNQYELTLEELRQKRKEDARQRMRESYRIAKGRRMNKIKSKKFHRLLKREKVRAQIKQFEELQKTDPEAALKQLELIERQRHEERATLRHKNTGAWAQNMQIRAKYDMDARKELAAQLSIGKELMGQRLVHEEDESSEGEQEGEAVEVFLERDRGNPWVGKQPGVHEQEANREFASGYRKYWDERNKVKEAVKQLEQENGEDESDEQSELEEENEDDSEEERELEVFKEKIQKSKAISTTNWEEEDLDEPEPVPKKKKRAGKDRSVEEIFNDAEELLQQKVEQKLKSIRKLTESQRVQKNASGDRKRNKKNQKIDLSMKKKASLADADVELDEGGSEPTTSNGSTLPKLVPNDLLVAPTATSQELTINPKQFVQMKPKHLLSAIPDLSTGGDLSDDEVVDHEQKQRMTIAEAFQDDDIVAEFEKEKQDERDRNQPKEVDTFLPGWGSWAGAGIKQNKSSAKTRRKMFKPAPVLPRRDDNKDAVIINEERSKKLTQHLVNELPFPFVSVKDYEASLRAPLGRTFIPETAHATLVEPRVVTKMGAVIEPMKKDILLQEDAAACFKVGGKLFNRAVKKYEEFLETREGV